MWIDDPGTTGAVAAEPTTAPNAAIASQQTPTGNTPDVSAPPEAPAATAAPAPNELQTQLATLAQETGFSAADLAGFESVSAARTAIADYYRSLQVPATGEQRVPPLEAPAPPTAPAVAAPVTALDLAALGLDDNDPAAKAIRQLEAGLAASRQEVDLVAKAVQEIVSQQKTASQVSRQRLESEAESIVSAFDSATYGRSGNRSAFQEQAVRRLYNLANGILIRAVENGQPEPSLRERLELARKLDDPRVQNAVAQQPPALPEKSVATPATSEPVSLFSSWRENPTMVNLVAGKLAG